METFSQDFHIAFSVLIGTTTMPLYLIIYIGAYRARLAMTSRQIMVIK